MKNTLLIIVALVVSFKTQAQLSKGMMLLSGSINYSKSHASTVDTGIYTQKPINNTTSFTGTIRYGYFVTNKIMVGIYGSYLNTRANTTSNYYDGSNYGTNVNKYATQNFSGGIFSRYYQMLGKSRFALFGQLSVGYGAGKQEQKTTYQYTGGSPDTRNSHSDITSFNVGFNPGLVFFVTKHIAIETSFGNAGFSAQRSKNYSPSNYNETKNSSFTTNLGFSLSSLTWGVNFYFGGKRDKPEVPGK